MFIQLCALSALHALGLGSYSLERHATLLNAFMINSLVVLLTVPANLHFLILLFRDAFDSTALQTQILQFENGHYISMMMKYAFLEFAFLFFTGISMIVMSILYFCKPFRWATRPAPSEEVIKVQERKVSRWIQFFSSSSSSKQAFEQVREEYSKLLALTQSSHLSLSSYILYSNKQSKQSTPSFLSLSLRQDFSQQHRMIAAHRADNRLNGVEIHVIHHTSMSRQAIPISHPRFPLPLDS